MELKYLLAKCPSFVPTPSDINWCEVRKDFTKFTNKVRQHAEGRQQQQQQQSNPQVNSEDLLIDESNFPLDKPPLKTNLYQQLYRSKPNKNNSLELFIDNIEKQLVNPSNIRKT